MSSTVPPPTPAVTVSGIKIFSMGDGFSRRNRFILSCALALGMGVTMVPQVRNVNCLKKTFEGNVIWLLVAVRDAKDLQAAKALPVPH